MRRTRMLWLVLVVFALLLHATDHLAAQSPPPPEMCGDGTTFRVNLPGVGTLPDGSAPPDDFVDLPNNCAIYAILVSGYARNPGLNELTFYNFAKFVAERNGYVHYAWWNNLLKPYMARPLHQKTINVPPFFDVSMTPGALDNENLLGFMPAPAIGGGVNILFPKAIPEEDDQFQADAERVLQGIRSHNPTAIIVVAGHSMGGGAVARLGATTKFVIDLLAPIDPVGNRTYPVGHAGSVSYNWTRWRAAHTFTGYRQVDCVRQGALCKDFDERFFYKEYHCEPVGPFLDRKPIIGSKAPGVCTGPWTDPGKRLKFNENIRHLLHRWQKENVFPFDYLKDEKFTYVGTDTPSVPGPLVFAQEGLGKNTLLESDPQKTCAAAGPPFSHGKPDPLDPTLICNSSDGHGEIVGFRGMDAAGAIPVGVQSMCTEDTEGEGHCSDTCEVGSYCPPPTTAAGRRTLLIAMTTAPAPHPFKVSTDAPAWYYEPLNPHLDMVVADMQRILEKILQLQPPPSLDITAPVTGPSLDPSPNEAGWHNTDVEVDYTASDNPSGSGVKEIDHALTGAQVAGAITPGSTAGDTVSAEGVTTVHVFARDNAGNAESPQTFDVRIDKTPPSVQAIPDVLSNAAGWNRTNVLVQFVATDGLSGVAATSDDVLVSAEGAAQEITGSAVDNAGNERTAAIVVNLDKTAPTVAIATPGDGASYAMGAVVNASFSCADALSGLTSCEGSVASGDPIDTSTPGAKQVSVTATDEAGNVTTTVRSYSVVAGQPRLAIVVAAKGVDSSGQYFVDLELKNTGAGPAQHVVINSLVFRTLTGTGAVTLNTALSGPLPKTVGNVNVGASTIQRLYLNVPATVLRFSITESGNVQDAAGAAFSYSASQAVIK